MKIKRITIVIGIFSFFALTNCALIAIPKYWIWVSEQSAQADLRRARAIAEANTLINESVKGRKDLLQYLKIQAIRENKNTIYVPTETALPILEGGRKQ